MQLDLLDLIFQKKSEIWHWVWKLKFLNVGNLFKHNFTNVFKTWLISPLYFQHTGFIPYPCLRAILRQVLSKLVIQMKDHFPHSINKRGRFYEDEALYMELNFEYLSWRRWACRGPVPGSRSHLCSGFVMRSNTLDIDKHQILLCHGKHSTRLI